MGFAGFAILCRAVRGEHCVTCEPPTRLPAAPTDADTDAPPPPAADDDVAEEEEEEEEEAGVGVGCSRDVCLTRAQSSSGCSSGVMERHCCSAFCASTTW